MRFASLNARAARELRTLCQGAGEHRFGRRLVEGRPNRVYVFGAGILDVLERL
jgi:hypothetical protein